MDNGEIHASGTPMTVGKGVAIYGACLLAISVLATLNSRIDAFPGILVVMAYAAMGFLLNRVVLRGLIEWHPMYNTLANVSSAKLGMMLLWPIRYPVLFFQLLVAKHL